MRSNLPVTQTALKVPEDQTLISITDVKGRITYANPNFVAVSGFLLEELVGQPHNMVRHPDMPEEAFRHLSRRTHTPNHLDIYQARTPRTRTLMGNMSVR